MSEKAPRTLALLICSPPYGALSAAEGVRHLNGREALGFDRATAVFADDGVWCLHSAHEVPPEWTSIRAGLERALEDQNVRVVADGDSLDARGLGEAALPADVERTTEAATILLGADTVLVF